MLRCGVQNLTELCFLFPDSILACAFSDIHGGPDKFYELARLVQNRMPDGMDVLDGSVGKNNTVVRFIICFLDFGLFQRVPECASGPRDDFC